MLDELDVEESGDMNGTKAEGSLESLGPSQAESVFYHQLDFPETLQALARRPNPNSTRIVT